MPYQYAVYRCLLGRHWQCLELPFPVGLLIQHGCSQGANLSVLRLRKQLITKNLLYRLVHVILIGNKLLIDDTRQQFTEVCFQCCGIAFPLLRQTVDLLIRAIVVKIMHVQVERPQAVCKKTAVEPPVASDQILFAIPVDIGYGQTQPPPFGSRNGLGSSGRKTSFLIV